MNTLVKKFNKFFNYLKRLKFLLKVIIVLVFIFSNQNFEKLLFLKTLNATLLNKKPFKSKHLFIKY